MHGYSGNARDFDFLARTLARDTRVVCPDLAGRGNSTWLASPFEYHFGRFLADIRALLDRLRIDEVDWVGTSMGGLLGLMLAAQAGTPIRRLVMNDVGAYLPLEALRHISANLQAPERFATLAEAEAHLRHTHRDWGDLTAAQWKHLAVHGTRRAEGGYRLHYDPQLAWTLQPPPFTPGLHFWSAWYRVRCPVLLLRGEASDVFPASVAATMQDIKPGTQVVELAGCGHAPSLMTPAHIAIVREFIAAEPGSMAAVRRGARHEPRPRSDPARTA